MGCDGGCPCVPRACSRGGQTEGGQGVEGQIGGGEGRAGHVCGFARLQAVGVRVGGTADEGNRGAGFRHLAGCLQERIHFRYRRAARRRPGSGGWQDQEVRPLLLGQREQGCAQRTMEAGEFREVQRQPEVRGAHRDRGIRQWHCRGRTEARRRELLESVLDQFQHPDSRAGTQRAASVGVGERRPAGHDSR